MNATQVRGLLLVAAVGLSACERSGLSREAGDPVRPARAAVSQEEASLLVAGKLIEIYGLESDPVPVRLLLDPAVSGGERVWKVRALVEVTVGGKRVERWWMFWVGLEGGRPEVLRAIEAAG